MICCFCWGFFFLIFLFSWGAVILKVLGSKPWVRTAAMAPMRTTGAIVATVAVSTAVLSYLFSSKKPNLGLLKRLFFLLLFNDLLLQISIFFSVASFLMICTCSRERERERESIKERYEKQKVRLENVKKYCWNLNQTYGSGAIDFKMCGGWDIKSLFGLSFLIT